MGSLGEARVLRTRFYISSPVSFVRHSNFILGSGVPIAIDPRLRGDEMKSRGGWVRVVDREIGWEYRRGAQLDA